LGDRHYSIGRDPVSFPDLPLGLGGDADDLVSLAKGYPGTQAVKGPEDRLGQGISRGLVHMVHGHYLPTLQPGEYDGLGIGHRMIYFGLELASKYLDKRM